MDDDAESDATPTTSNLPDGAAPRKRGGVARIDSLAMFRIVYRENLVQYPENIRKEVEWLFEAVSAESRRYIMSDFVRKIPRLLERNVRLRATVDGLPSSHTLSDFVRMDVEEFRVRNAELEVKCQKLREAKKAAQGAMMGATECSNEGGKSAAVERVEPPVSSVSSSSGPGTSRKLAEGVINMTPAVPVHTTYEGDFVFRNSSRGIQDGFMSYAPIEAEPASRRREEVCCGDKISGDVSSMVTEGAKDVDCFMEEVSEERMQSLRKKWRRKMKKLVKG